MSTERVFFCCVGESIISPTDRPSLFVIAAVKESGQELCLFFRESWEPRVFISENVVSYLDPRSRRTQRSQLRDDVRRFIGSSTPQWWGRHVYLDWRHLNDFWYVDGGRGWFPREWDSPPHDVNAWSAFAPGFASRSIEPFAQPGGVLGEAHRIKDRWQRIRSTARMSTLVRRFPNIPLLELFGPLPKSPASGGTRRASSKRDSS